MKWICLPLLTVIACSSPEPLPPQTSAQAYPGPVQEPPPVTGSAEPSPAQTTDTNAPAGSARNITIEEVTVANPLVVRGKARTFENNVALRVKDSAGRLVSESFTTAQGEMGTHSPYEGTLWLTRDPGARVTVEALEYSAKDGSEQSLVSVTRPFDVEPVQATLYFPDENCTTVRTYTRAIPKTVSMARVLVEALMAGPVEQERRGGATLAFPTGSRVQSINLRDGVLTVDFNERLQNVGGSCRAQMIRDSVTQTLSKLPSVTRVVITAAGSEKLALQP